MTCDSENGGMSFVSPSVCQTPVYAYLRRVSDLYLPCCCLATASAQAKSRFSFAFIHSNYNWIQQEGTRIQL